MLRIEQVVANLFGCGGRLGCIWDWHRDGNRQNDDADQRRTKDSATPLDASRRLIQRLVISALAKPTDRGPQT
jgi:hypothetical protein